MVGEDAAEGDGVVSYIQGFLLPVPDANKQAYRDMAAAVAPLFAECGALRTVECWGADVPEGKRTDMKRAVQLADGESVVFAWVWWADKAACDAGAARMQADERMGTAPDPMPFDGKRMIYGGFEVAHDSGDTGKPIGYVDGIVVQLAPERRDELKPFLERMEGFFTRHGALRVVDGVGDAIPDGKVTDFRRAVDAGPDALIVFGWVEWPDKATRDAGMGAMMSDTTLAANPPPWDGPTGIFGGFVPILDTDHD